MTLVDHARDPLHELEMTRALLAQARLQNPLNLTLIRGLEQEVEWWRIRAERALAKERG